jgi:cell fate regulator YaaT (PSP1 superfamily)
MCCLDYELEYYKELTKEIPKIGSKVNVFGGEHRIEKVDIFNRSVMLTDADRNVVSVQLELLQDELRKEPPAETKAKDDPPKPSGR